MDARVVVDIRPLIGVRARLNEVMHMTTPGPLRDAIHQWAKLYRSFSRRRFDVFSKGGGDWAPLAESTRLRRRDPKGHTGASRISTRRRALRQARAALQEMRNLRMSGLTDRQVDRLARRTVAVRRAKRALKREETRQRDRKMRILRDTGTLFNTLTPEFTGLPGQMQEDVPAGVLVGFSGDERHPGSKHATIGEIAGYHQSGGPYLPRREILVQPPDDLVDKMAEVFQAALEEVAKDEGTW